MYIKGVTKHDNTNENQNILVLKHTTGIKLASKSETTSHTYQHQALVDQLHELIANTDLNKLSYLNLDAYQNAIF